MPISPCYLFKNSFEFLPISDINMIPIKVRGIYVLYNSKDNHKMNVVYIGMARGENSGVRGRLESHRRNKPKLWTHFSVYEVWDNIAKQQVEELEGLFRHIYRYDNEANKLNQQKSYSPLKKIHRRSQKDWI
jgi:hypothetical protein